MTIRGTAFVGLDGNVRRFVEPIAIMIISVLIIMSIRLG